MATAVSRNVLVKPRSKRRAPVEYLIYLIDVDDLPPVTESFDAINEVDGFITEWSRLELVKSTGLVPAVRAVRKGGAS
jgi:hypothetical protein